MRPALASNLCHVRWVLAHYTTAFFACLSGFFRCKRMRRAETLSRLATKAMNLARFLRVHGGESLFAFVAFIRHASLLFRLEL